MLPKIKLLLLAAATTITFPEDAAAAAATTQLDRLDTGRTDYQFAKFTPAPRIPQAFIAAVTHAPIIDGGNYASSPSSEKDAGNLLARQAGCQASYTSCTNIGQPGICCQPDTICTTDNARKAACCPRGAACTGTIGGGGAGGGGGGGGSNTVVATSRAATVVAGGTGAGASGVGQSTLTVTVTAGYSAPESVGAGGGTAGPTGTVPNAQFPFAYIPHSFSNAAVCTSYVQSCSETFSSCTAALGGGGSGGGVTVVGAGITTANGGGLASASAASICSSLSSQACFGLQTQQCSAYGSAKPNGAPAGFGAPAADILHAGLGVGLGMLGAVMA